VKLAQAINRGIYNELELPPGVADVTGEITSTSYVARKMYKDAAAFNKLL